MDFRFIVLDEKDIHQHSFIQKEDNIIYLGLYYSGEGYRGEGNSLILNLKKPVDRRGSDEWQYKQDAINFVAQKITEVMDDVSSEKGRWYWIPIPPSKLEGNPMFDDRINQILELAQSNCSNQNNIVANVIKQNSDREASSTSGNTRNVDTLRANYTMLSIPSSYDPFIDEIIVFDDMLTTGCHFKAAQKLILDSYPNARVNGVFIARRDIREE